VAIRETIRSAAFPLFAQQGIAQTTNAQIASAAGLTEPQVLDEFAAPVQIALVNDHYPRILELFVSDNPELSPSAAWIVALDEAISGMDAVAWQNETERQRIVERDPAVAPFGVEIGTQAVQMTVDAVAKRTGLSADSPKVASFAGALIGSIAGLPSGNFPDAASWVAAHAATNEAVGASLDKLLH